MVLGFDTSGAVGVVSGLLIKLGFKRNGGFTEVGVLWDIFDSVNLLQ